MSLVDTTTESESTGEQYPIVLGVDIGGTSVKMGAIDIRNGRVVRERSFPTPKGGSQKMAKDLAKHVRVITVDYPDVAVVGIGVPGAMNNDRSLVRYPPNLDGWLEEPLAENVRAALPWIEHVEVDNDAKVATLAEARLGAGKGVDNFLLVTLGTGVGGGVYLDGKIFRGVSGGAGEFGHTTIDYNGPLCGCGEKGCIEAYLGQKHLSRLTLEKLRAGKQKSSLITYLDE
jgi:glucokinase